MGYCTLWRLVFCGDGSHSSLWPHLKYTSYSTTKWICSQMTPFHDAFIHLRDAFLDYVLSRTSHRLPESTNRFKGRGAFQRIQGIGSGVGEDLDCDLMVECRRRDGPGLNVMRVWREHGVNCRRSLTNTSMECISRAGHHGKPYHFWAVHRAFTRLTRSFFSFHARFSLLNLSQ